MLTRPDSYAKARHEDVSSLVEVEINEDGEPRMVAHVTRFRSSAQVQIVKLLKKKNVYFHVFQEWL